MPRLLPLLAVAAVGVLAVNLLENGPGMIGAARGFAEELAKGGKGKPRAPSPLPDNATPAGAAPVVVAARPAPVCAPSAAQLAQEAGLSPAELQVLQSLGARRDALDQRAQGLDTQISLIAAAEAKVNARITAMNALKADMQALLGQVDGKQQAEVDRLVKVFEAMKPADSAARFTLLSDEVRLPIAARMKERLLSAMLAKMAPPEAKRLTESLASRYVAEGAAARQAMSPTVAATPAAAATAAPATPPAKVAQAADGAATPATPPKAHRKPRAHQPARTAGAAASGGASAAVAAPQTSAAASPPPSGKPSTPGATAPGGAGPVKPG